MGQGLLIESLNVVKSLLHLMHNQSLEKLSASASKSATPISNRESSSSPDVVSNEVKKEDEQTPNHTSCECSNNVGVADVVTTYLVLFPKLIFDVCKLNQYDHSHPREWEGTKEAIQCCQCSCDLLIDFLSLSLSGL